MFDDEEEIGFVICASCGARIKANRERCLRCEAPLVAWQKPELLPSWLQRWGGDTLIFGIVAIVVVLVIAVVAFDSRQVSDDVARPVSNAKTSARTAALPVAPDAAALPVAVGAIEPPDFLDVRRGTADLSGDIAAARAKYEAAIARTPDSPELLNNLGLALERLGQIDAAIVRFERAAQLDPQGWAYHFNLAHAVSQRRGLERAIAEYRLAAGLAPADYATQYNLGMLLHRKGDEVAAIPEFQKGIELAPTVSALHLALAISFERSGRKAEAQREFEAYVEMAPAAPDAASVKSHLRSLTGASGS
jgi:Flp pilus assembly protein TadD